MAGLTACPICRSNLERFPEADRAALKTCPDCGASLGQFKELKLNAEHYRDLALECLSRGETAQARLILDALARLLGGDELPLDALRCRAALAGGDFDAAEALLDRLSGPERDTLAELLNDGRQRLRLSQEQYNHALTCARQSSFREAQFHIARAAALAPGNAAAWLLKLKIDLSAGDLAACYEDLAQLDRLGGRPREFARLESILPPV